MCCKICNKNIEINTECMQCTEYHYQICYKCVLNPNKEVAQYLK